MPQGGPPPVEGAAGLKFAENATPEQLLSVSPSHLPLLRFWVH
jgi:hypothetical protein